MSSFNKYLCVPCEFTNILNISRFSSTKVDDPLAKLSIIFFKNISIIPRMSSEVSLSMIRVYLSFQASASSSLTLSFQIVLGSTNMFDLSIAINARKESSSFSLTFRVPSIANCTHSLIISIILIIASHSLTCSAVVFAGAKPKTSC